MADDESVRSLLDDLSLVGVSYFELSTSRFDEPISDGLVAQDVDIEPEFTLGIARSEDENRVRVRVKTEISMPFGNIVVDLAAEYQVATKSVSDLSDDLMVSFVNKVAMMTLIPYIRQAVSDMTARVFELPLVMPMYRQGELTFPPP